MPADGCYIKKIESGVQNDEADQFKNAYLDLFNAPENLKYLSFTQIPFSGEMVSDWFSRALREGVEYYCAFNMKGQITAISIIKIDYINGFEIIGFVVDQRYRRMGIGKQIIEYIVELAGSRGFKTLSVSVFTDNKPMLLLLIGLGFIPSGISYHMRSDGCDLLHLRKYLAG